MAAHQHEHPHEHPHSHPHPLPADPVTTAGDDREYAWYAGDHHIHTTFSRDAMYSVDDQVRRGHECGLDWMVITDHGGPDHAKQSVALQTPLIAQAVAGTTSSSSRAWSGTSRAPSTRRSSPPSTRAPPTCCSASSACSTATSSPPGRTPAGRS